jgi:hypothetical protein
MATITNIRIYTQSKAVPNAGYIAIDKVMMEGNTIVAMGGDVRYVLGVVPMENIVVDTPSVPEECGCNTTNANIFATLIKGVDGVTPDMSDYYDKNVIDEKLGKKQDAISDLEAIRSGASKGATALQQRDVDPELTLSRNPIQSRAVTLAFGQMDTLKQDVISDLATIRDGAAKGATALQSVPSEYVTESELQGKGYATTAQVDAKQDTISDLEAIREGAAKGATALQEHQPLKTINGESIVGEGNIEIEGGIADLEGYATEEYVNTAVETVNVKGEDGYVYSNGEKVDMRFTRSLIPVGTSIPANANLNTVAYLKVGKYYCSLNADAKTITNCPTTSAFSMEVFNPLSPVVDNETTDPYVYRIRILTVYNTGVQYIQYAAVSSTINKWTYNSWYVVPRSPFTLNSNKKGGSAALGSATQGVYINSEGTFTKMTYTLGKSVPSSAVFTDTKVTAVGNHYTPVENESVAIAAGDGEVVVGLKRDAVGHIVGIETTSMTDYVDNAIKTAITEALTTEV